MRNRSNRNKRCRGSNNARLKNWSGRKFEKAIAHPDASTTPRLPMREYEVVASERTANYRTPEHGFDWKSLELPVEAVALGHCGILDFFTIR